MILSVLEKRLLAALQAIFPSNVSLIAGPLHEPDSEQTELVNICAEKLSILSLPFNEKAGNLRGPAFFSHTHRWSADGETRDFEWPEEITGEVTEVESPSGHPVKVGDDYQLQGRILKFYKPPAEGDEAVAVTLRGQSAKGYQDKLPCEISISLTALAGNMEKNDQMLFKSLSALLAACVDLGNIEDRSIKDSPEIRVRLLQPVASLAGIERTAKKFGDSHHNQAEARLIIRGELEITVAIGVPEPEGIIEKIEYSVNLPDYHPKSMGAPQKSSVRKSVRSIESKIITYIEGIGDSFSNQLGQAGIGVKTLGELSRINPDEINTSSFDISLHRLWEFKTKAEIILNFECPSYLPQPLLDMSLSKIVDTKCEELAVSLKTYPTGRSEQSIEKLKINLRMLQVVLTDWAFREINLKDLVGSKNG